MSDRLPASVEVVEVGPRDGLQNEPTVIDTATKLAFIESALAAGVRRIEVASFVNPRRVPQMADAEEVLRALPPRTGVQYVGLVLNRKGFERALAAGYKRPGLVLDPVIDELIEGRFTAGFLTGQSRLVPVKERTQPFHEVAAARHDRTVFARWLEKNQPDVIFTLYHEVQRWLHDLGLRVPQDLGLIQYEWRPDHHEWAGMDQRNDLVGEAALDMLISMVHHNEHGVPDHPRATMIGCHWVDGETVLEIPRPAGT